MQIEACIFDLDGVIVDSAKYHFLAWKKLADKLAIPFSHEQNESLKGVSRVDSLEKILSWGGIELNNNKKIELLEAKNQWYLKYTEEMKSEEILPGVFEFLTELKKSGIKIALGSSSKNAVLILDKLQIADFFDEIIDGNKIHFSKPHPEVFLKAAAGVRCRAESCVVFEDAISGVDAALAGHFKCIGIGDPLFLSKAHAVVSNMEDMSVEKMKTLLLL
ncbi:MAG: beta-phosphoglucomutase [Flavobacteriales bacterium]|nr:beta-phosphoglucomutase [Flavobacteriales bacterium]